MANLIDFDTEIKRYYDEVYRKNNPYADLLAPLVRGYAGANQQISDEVMRQQRQNVAQTQRSVADIYASFTKGRQGLESAGFSESYTKGMGRTLGSGASESYVDQTRKGAAATPQPQYLDMSQDPLYKAYADVRGQEITATSKLTKGIFSYLNQKETMSDEDYALAAGYIEKTDDGRVAITEKGKIAIQYYTGQIDVGEEETDELLTGKGTFKTYFREQLGDAYDGDVYNKAIADFSTIAGSEKAFGDPYSNDMSYDDKIKMFGGSVHYVDEGTDFTNTDRYKVLKDKKAPDMEQKVKSASGQEYTIAEMIRYGFAEGMQVKNKDGDKVVYHDGKWYHYGKHDENKPRLHYN